MNEYTIVVKGELPGKKKGSSARMDHSDNTILEEKVVFPSSGNDIRGIVTRPATESQRRDFIVFLHGFAGNKDENGLFKDAADRFAANGFSSLRFDFSGHGESGGESLDLSISREIEDFKSALGFVRGRFNPGAIYALGFSLGAYIALKVPEPEINGYILWSPALKPNKDMYPRYCTEQIKQELKENGCIDKAGLKIGSKIISELSICDIEPQIKEISQPMLIIHGTKDERISFSTSRTFYRHNSEHMNIKFSQISNAGHSYKEKTQYREAVFLKTMGWLSAQMPSQGN
jgi:alpha-beta hydrolase superfamily lysophospholipase